MAFSFPGAIPAGPLEEVLAQAEEITEPANLLAYREEIFCCGFTESMMGDGILDRMGLAPSEPGGPAWRNCGGACGGAHEAADAPGAGEIEIILRASNPRYPDLVAKAGKSGGYFRGLIRRLAHDSNFVRMEALPELVAEKFPQSPCKLGGRLPIGCKVFDVKGFLRGAITEVCGSSAGGSLLLAAVGEAAVRDGFLLV